ncbi:MULTISPECIES: proline--tRNA ligase [Coprobacillaceae]|uniref:proline--tRNA ligase n=1 Tax=Coprobacillaceae TaxID=2810280 RepID=UPI000E4DACDD|nr:MULTISPECIES: proline--tRNA ligase [Coprobacillaceae]RHM58881.1 proline--tRNA ligase [Coprobacillus sp. AF33-1AC]RHS91246.1 proline--tRNA ligase [Erysipelatoclostridium sp. AM42-17]
MANNKKNEAITAMEDDFAQWYTDVCRKAELMDYSSVKGFIIYRPYSYAMWEQIQNYMDRRFKETGHENVYMPLVIPQSLLQKEADHVEGFAPECAVVTKGGLDDLEENLVIRPTSETLFCEHYAKIVNSYRDLPKLYNQWCSVVRWEKTTRPFLRGAEFLWQEGHTIHSTEEEARKETLQMLGIYEETCKELLAIPMITGRKTEKEKFAGAEETYTIEALMHDGKALQSGTSHYFGQGFAKAFDVKFLNKENKLEYVYQTSWGASTRLLGAIIMVHGDNNGLVLPPRVAPIQVMIVPVMQHKEGVLDKAYEIEQQLKAAGIRVKVDASDKTPGYKFADAEMRGIPLRLEIGPKDIQNNQCVLARRVDGTKEKYALDENLAQTIKNLMDEIHEQMYNKALAFRDANTHTAHDYDEFKDILENKGGYIRMMWCGDEACELKIKEDTGATSRCIKDEEPFGDVCPICGKPAKKVVYFAKAY